jgi:hypothetical protein
MCDYKQVISVYELFHLRNGCGKVRVLVMQDDVLDRAHRADGIDLSYNGLKLQHRAWIDQNGFITVFNKVGMTLKRIVFKIHTNPVNLVSNLNWASKIHINTFSNISTVYKK